MSGAENERRFVKLFNSTDTWKAQRAAASGAGGDADLPDVTFAHGGIAFAGELKTTSGPYIYIEEGEMDALRSYAAAFGMVAVGIGRFSRDRSFYVWNPNDMERTDAGSYRGDPEVQFDASEDQLGWAARIADPDGTADGIYPEDLTGFHLRHAVAGKLGGGVTRIHPDGGED